MKPETLAELFDKLEDELREVASFEEAEWPALLREIKQAILSRHVEQPAETEERKLGEWLVKNEGWTHLWVSGDEWEELTLYTDRAGYGDFEGRGPTKAAAIREALRLAKETEGG